MSKTTENYGLTKPEVGEFFSLETWNENMDKIDGELKKREDAQKESDNSLMNPKFTEAKERKNLTSGEKIHLMLGKISRFFSDMKAIAFSGSYNDLVDKPKIPTVLNNQTTTEEGYALDARQANPNIDGTLAKQLSDLNGSLNNNSKKITLMPRKWAGVYIRDEIFKVNEAAGGVIFHPPMYLKEIRFIANGTPDNSGVVAQAGFCTSDASVPEVYTTGEKRIDYVNYGSSGDCVLDIDGKIGYFFIAGPEDLVITNLFGILY